LALIQFQASRFKELLDPAPVVLDYLEHIADCELPFGSFVGSIQHNQKTFKFLISHWVLTFLPNK